MGVLVDFLVPDIYTGTSFLPPFGPPNQAPLDLVPPGLACSVKNMTKTDIYWGLYRIHIFVFLTPLGIFLPRLETLFFINIYVVVVVDTVHLSVRFVQTIRWWSSNLVH